MEIIDSILDRIKFWFAIFFVFVGILGFLIFNKKLIFVRFGTFLIGMSVAFLFIWFSRFRRYILNFFIDSYHELNRVVWPTHKEVIQTTSIVFIFVLIMSLFMFILDKGIELILYNFLLDWK